MEKRRVVYLYKKRDLSIRVHWGFCFRITGLASAFSPKPARRKKRKKKKRTITTINFTRSSQFFRQDYFNKVWPPQQPHTPTVAITQALQNTLKSWYHNVLQQPIDSDETEVNRLSLSFVGVCLASFPRVCLQQQQKGCHRLPPASWPRPQPPQPHPRPRPPLPPPPPPPPQTRLRTSPRSKMFVWFRNQDLQQSTCAFRHQRC